jgi:hypothetical protein
VDAILKWDIQRIIVAHGVVVDHVNRSDDTGVWERHSAKDFDGKI